MTLIAFATYGADRAEFITDSASYTRRVSHMGRTTKHLTIAHLDAAVLTQGDSTFGRHAKTGMLDMAEVVSTFDELVDVAPEALRMLWSALVEQGATHEEGQGVVFLLGWSDRDERFRAWGCASDDDFQPFKIPGLWVMPTPWSTRPSKLELRRMEQDMAGHPDVEKAAEIWQQRAPMPPPRSVQDWIDLALDAREQRSLSGGFNHVIVAGDVFHTRLKRGSIETRKVHTFNDSGEEFLKMIEHTEHPLALAGPCWCDSGEPYGACHALKFPCGCRSGKLFGECCMVSPAGVPTQS